MEQLGNDSGKPGAPRDPEIDTWVEAKTRLRSTNFRFPQFQHLPSEIRGMIWEFCLPQRIIPFSTIALAQEHFVTGPPFPAGDRLVQELVNRALVTPSLISLVCRESRAVVLRSRLPIEALDMPWLGHRGWFDPRTDTLLLDCDFYHQYREVWRQVQRELLPSAAGERSRPGQRDIRIGLHETLARNDHPFAPNAGQCLDACGNITQKWWPLVLIQNVFFNLPLPESTVPGIFGSFGEEQPVFVNIGDHDQLLRLSETLGTLGRYVYYPHRSFLDVALGRWKRCVKHEASQGSTESPKIPMLPEPPESGHLAPGLLDSSGPWIPEAERQLARFLSGLEQRHPLPFPALLVDGV